MKLKAECEVLLQAMREAGRAILHFQKTGFSISKKANQDVLTEADLRANHILKSALLTAFPKDGWLSEECVDDTKRLTKKRVWVVDPIDGTIEYAKGIAEYAISVALIVEGVPVLASVFNPATNECFYAMKGEGAYCGDQPIHCKATANAALTLLASRSEFKRGEWDTYLQSHVVKVVGSVAYKLALVAAGRADATFSLCGKSEWDIAAGVLLVQEAGGRVSDRLGQPIVFNQKNVRVASVVAASDAAFERVLHLISA